MTTDSVDSAVLDGEAVVLRPDNLCDFEALRSRQDHAEAILVTYDVRRSTARPFGLKLLGETVRANPWNVYDANDVPPLAGSLPSAGVRQAN